MKRERIRHGVRLTREIAYAAGRDVANRRMRAAGRNAWGEGDYNAACAEFERLCPPPTTEAADDVAA